MNNYYQVSNKLNFKNLINSPAALLLVAVILILMSSKMSPNKLISDYFNSFLNVKSSYPSHNINLALQLVIGAVFAGYTATAFPPDFLKLFEHPIAQFFIFFLLFNTVERINGFPRIFIIIDALMFTIFIQIAIRLIKEYYKNKDENKIQ